MKIIRALSITLITFCFTAGVFAATFNVNTTFDTPDVNPGNGVCANASAQCSFRAAISEANSLAGDDVINLPAGTYTHFQIADDEDNNLGGDWDIRSNITINGAGRDLTILQAAANVNSATERVLEIVLANLVTINGVTIQNGNKREVPATATENTGGGIRNAGTLTINNSTVSSNRATNGGGIENDLNLILNGVTVESNTAQCPEDTCFGGGLNSDPPNFGAVIIVNSTFTGNNVGSSMTGGASGGGAAFQGQHAYALSISGSTFTQNLGSNGCGAFILGNNAAGDPAQSRATVSDSAFNGNFCSGEGGGIAVANSGSGAALSITFNRSTVNGNNNFVRGGGMSVHATGAGLIDLAINNSTISNNGCNSVGGIFASVAGAGASGGINLNVLNSTISGNTSGASGGGVLLQGSAPSPLNAVFNFTTITNNRANGPGGGPTVEGGGGIRAIDASATLKNSIVSGNLLSGAAVNADLMGNFASQDYNHLALSAGTVIVPQAHDVFNTSAMLGALANNGGPTLTHLPDLASPVRNTIPNGANDCGTIVAMDQRGFVRPVESACDKGAVEHTQFAPGPWSVSGSIMTSDGMPIRNAEVVLTGGGLAQPIKVYTGNFGQYGFTNLTGAAYRVSVSAKRFRFQTSNQIVELNNNAANVNFMANPQFEGKAVSSK